jgi:hypothetical protein
MMVFGFLLVAIGIAILAMARPWRVTPGDDDPKPSEPPSRAGRWSAPKPESGRRVPAEPGRPEIPLPEWLGPVSGRR